MYLTCTEIGISILCSSNETDFEYIPEEKLSISLVSEYKFNCIIYGTIKSETCSIGDISGE